MAFCSYCGCELMPGARFCASCGSPVESAVAAVSVPTEPIPAYQPVGDQDYGLVLYSVGTCAKSYADDVLEDTLGYSDSEAKQLIRSAPVQIAQLLTREQAQYLAQALTEYGMQVAVYKGESPVDLSQSATASVFNSDGSFVAGVLSALAGISLVNRLTRPRRWTLTNVLSHLFAPRYKAAPPRHVSRLAFRREPAPVRVTPPRRVSMPRREEPKRRFVSGPAGNGAPGGRGGGPGGQGRGSGGRGR